jgi:F-type H+-transporting ATPase subunit a
LGKPAAALLAALRIAPQNPAYPIPNHIAMELVVFAFAVVFFLWLKRRLSVDKPGATQQCMEMVLTNPMGVGVRDLLDDMVGHGATKYMPMLGSIGLFVLFSNVISVVPGFESPTATNSVPLGCAVLVFLYYNWCGIRHHGLPGYAKHFTGPDLGFPFPLNLIMSLVMVTIETVSHLARLLSLTVRLWVNMLVSELLYGTFLGLTLALFIFVRDLNPIGYLLAPVPLVVPCVFILLHVFVGFLQAFVFTLLPVIYVSGAVEEEH